MFKIDTLGVNNDDITEYETCRVKFVDIFAIDSRCFCIREDNHISKRNFDIYMDRLDRFLIAVFRDVEEALEGRTVG